MYYIHKSYLKIMWDGRYEYLYQTLKISKLLQQIYENTISLVTFLQSIVDI